MSTTETNVCDCGAEDGYHWDVCASDHRNRVVSHETTPIYDETRAALDRLALAAYQVPDLRMERKRVADALRVDLPGHAMRAWWVLVVVAAALVVCALLVVTL
jgi:hypothetical protein